MLRLLAALGALILLVLPGCWLTMLGPLRAFPLNVRLSLGILLCPVAVVAEFYVLRLAGISFATTAAILPLLQLPVLWPLWSHLRAGRRPSPRTILLWTAALALPLACLLYWMLDPAVRVNWGHAWTHTDIVYAIANGQLRPEEPYLAGVRLAYPWMLHVYYAVVGFLFGQSPNDSYLWVNLAMLAGTLGLMAALVGELGGSGVARATSAIWLAFGINLAFTAWLIVPVDVMEQLPRIWGDGRFSPWLRKFGLFAPSAYGLGLCVAILYFVARPTGGRISWLTAGLCGVLVLALGFFYPILLPAAVAMIGARVGAPVLIAALPARVRPNGNTVSMRDALGESVRMIVCVVGALIAAAMFLRVVTADRSSAAALGIDTLYNMKLKSVAAILVLAPLAIGVLLAFRDARRLPVESLTLLGAAVACVVLNVVFHIYWDRNEYKFMFAAAASLVPLAALGFSKLAERWGKSGAIELAALCVIFAFPGLYRSYREHHDRNAPPVHVRSDRFGLSLDPSERYAGVLEAVRRESPVTAVLLARRGDIDLVALTSRSMLVPYDSGFVHGMGLTSNHLLKRVRSYPGDIVDQRRRALSAVFDSGSVASALAMDALLRDLRRPLVLLVDSTDTRVAEWLPSRPDTRLLFGEQGLQAWLVGTDASGGKAGTQ